MVQGHSKTKLRYLQYSGLENKHFFIHHGILYLTGSPPQTRKE